MAVSFVGVTDDKFGGSGSRSFTTPTGVQEGDFLIFVGSSSSSGSWSGSGWSGGGSGTSVVMTRVVPAGNPGSYTFTVPSAQCSAFLAAYRGVNAAGVSNSTNAQVFASGSSVVTAPVRTVGVSEWLVVTWGASVAKGADVVPQDSSMVTRGNVGPVYTNNPLRGIADRPGGAGIDFDLNVTATYTSTMAMASVILPSSNTAPNAPAWVTATGQTVDVAADSLLDWDFSDPDPGDSQSQFVLDRWALDSNGARVGAAVRVVQSTPVTSYTIPGGSLVAGTQYEFKVATRDAQGLPTLDADLLFSTSLFQTFKAKPSAPTITAPAAGATVGVTDTLTWSTPNQDAYQVQQLDGSGVLVPGTDTGEVTDATTRSLTLSFPTNNVTRTPRVRRKYGGLWSDWATVTVTVSWTPPAVPTVTWTAVPADAAIDVAITNPAPGAGEPAVSYNDIYFAEPGEPEERKATLVPPNSTWRHWLPDSDAVYSYRVVSVATNGTTAETTAA